MKTYIATICLSLTSLLSTAQNTATGPKPVSAWFPTYDFDAGAFQKPALSFGPFARWWWPGNDVTPDELRREIDLFAANRFGGVEIQPLNLGIPLTPKDVADRVLSWDTPVFYENVKAVLEEARKQGLTVDMTNGSGWPPGGSFLAPEDGFLSLEFGAATVAGGKTATIPVPTVENRSKVPARLQAVVVAKIAVGTTETTGQPVRLEAASTRVLTTLVKNDSLRWAFPGGQWKVIAFWSIPSREQTNISASPRQGPVVDHLDSAKVLRMYTHLFGPRTGLQPYFGNPLRAIFNDSYEFKANRHYSPDFIAYFRQKRGYDITPWLAANMQKGYNFVSFMRPNAKPDFSFSEQDWRLRYDYDITLGELLGEHFFKTSRHWMEKQGLLHRTQAYGLNMDMIAMAGLASIPETESMLGSEANMKIMTSGGHLYNRPLISAESVVFINQAYTTTPQKIRLAVDKLLAAGVNQIIYHGVPYRYTPPRLGPEGWYPFSTPFLSVINFASNLGEGNPFWPDQKAINEYISRAQYALRAGKPHADVLIYFPFLNVEGMPDNPAETMTNGHIADVEGPLPVSKDKPDAAKAAWTAAVYPLINQLEARGITWEWVNDASLQAATIGADKQLTIRGNRYQALILGDSSTIQLNTAVSIQRLAANGLKLLAINTLPTNQPSYLNWQANDAKTAQLIASAVKQPNSRHIRQVGEVGSWIQSLNQSVAFANVYPFTRQVQREMPDGSRIQFVWNKSKQWQTLSLTLDKRYTGSYWLDAETGAITQNTATTISYRLAPYGSIILYATTKKSVPTTVLTPLPLLAEGGRIIHQLDSWAIETDSLTLHDSPLFDWKTNDSLRFTSGNGRYTTSFQLADKQAGAHYFLDLGRVYFTAAVTINGQPAGRRLYAPYQLDITLFVKQGINQLDVRVTSTALNSFIGKANQGDARYKQFKGKTDQVMSAGLVGPVRILEK